MKFLKNKNNKNDDIVTSLWEYDVIVTINVYLWIKLLTSSKLSSKSSSFAFFNL